jgi:hypothetical protein
VCLCLRVYFFIHNQRCVNNSSLSHYISIVCDHYEKDKNTKREQEALVIRSQLETHLRGFFTDSQLLTETHHDDDSRAERIMSTTAQSRHHGCISVAFITHGEEGYDTTLDLLKFVSDNLELGLVLSGRQCRLWWAGQT